MIMKAWWLVFAGGLTVLALIAWSMARMSAPPSDAPPRDPPVASTPAPAAETAHITATLFFGSPDGQALVPLRRDVTLAQNVVEQGRHILTAQLQEVPPDPYVSVIPEGTTLRAFYLTDRGDAFVDLSPEIVAGHAGGSSSELLTVYALVGAVTANLPSAKRVQILVDGREIDTLAGHVDLRRPLSQDGSLVRQDGN